MKSRIVLVGVGGYGDTYLTLLEEYVDPERFTLVGVADPFVERAPRYEWLQEKKIPLYRSLEDFYWEQEADLALLVSPVQLHRSQTELALKNGSHVLCEKPITPLLQDAYAMREAERASGKRLGIGFQWSWCKAMRSVKQDILDGLYGKPILLKTHISWKRGDSYYAPDGWKGRMKAKDGSYILDTIASNATAHYLHNMLFLLGGDMNSAAMPDQIWGSLFRGRDIETYDTCFIKGVMQDGCELLYIATHTGEQNSDPQFEYIFEKGCILFDQNGDGEVTGTLADGSVRKYGKALSMEENAWKITGMLDVAQLGAEPCCTVDTALPHLTVCNALIFKDAVTDFPSELRIREENGSFVKGLFEASLACYQRNKLPEELGYSWAPPATLF